MCKFDCYYQKVFLEGRLGSSICLQPIWDFSNTFLFPKIPILKLLRQVFFKKFLQNSAIMLSCFEDLLFVGSQLIWQCHDICTPSSKMGEENFSKKSVVAGQKIFDYKEGKVG